MQFTELIAIYRTGTPSAHRIHRKKLTDHKLCEMSFPDLGIGGFPKLITRLGSCNCSQGCQMQYHKLKSGCGYTDTLVGKFNF